MLSRFGEFLKCCVQYACITHCTFEYIGDFVVCNGPSMEPTLYTNNVLLTERVSPRFQRPHRGDVVIAVSPNDPKQYICKRIMGLPGDKIITTLPQSEEAYVTTDSGKVDKLKQVEDYVPKGYVWVEGDNPSNSADSRYYGPIPQGLIRSRVICRLWPLSDIRLL